MSCIRKNIKVNELQVSNYTFKKIGSAICVSSEDQCYEVERDGCVNFVTGIKVIKNFIINPIDNHLFRIKFGKPCAVIIKIDCFMNDKNGNVFTSDFHDIIYDTTIKMQSIIYYSKGIEYVVDDDTIVYSVNIDNEQAGKCIVNIEIIGFPDDTSCVIVTK